MRGNVPNYLSLVLKKMVKDLKEEDFFPWKEIFVPVEWAGMVKNFGYSVGMEPLAMTSVAQTHPMDPNSGTIHDMYYNSETLDIAYESMCIETIAERDTASMTSLTLGQKVSLVKNAHDHLVKANKYTIAKECIDKFNYGDSIYTNVKDGLNIFSASHTIGNGVFSGVQSNTSTTTFSVHMGMAMRRAEAVIYNDENHHGSVRYKVVFVSPAHVNHEKCLKLYGADQILEPGTADNDKNLNAGRVRVVAHPDVLAGNLFYVDTDYPQELGHREMLEIDMEEKFSPKATFIYSFTRFQPVVKQPMAIYGFFNA